VLLRYSLTLDIRGDQKSSHVKGWCGSRWLQSPGEFDDLDAPESVRILNAENTIHI
jgi:hypothetical protein